MTSRFYRLLDLTLAFLLALTACAQKEGDVDGKPMILRSPEEEFRQLHHLALSDASLEEARGQLERFRRAAVQSQEFDPAAQQIWASLSLEPAQIAALEAFDEHGRTAAGVLQALQLGSALAQPDEARKRTLYELFGRISRRLEYGWFQARYDAYLAEQLAGGLVSSSGRVTPAVAPLLDAQTVDELFRLFEQQGERSWSVRVLGWRIGAQQPEKLIDVETRDSWRHLATLEPPPARDLDRLLFLAAGGRREELLTARSVSAEVADQKPSAKTVARIVELFIRLRLPWEGWRYLEHLEQRWGVRYPRLAQKLEAEWQREFVGRVRRLTLPWVLAGVRVVEGMTLRDFAVQQRSRAGPGPLQPPPAGG